MVYAASIDTRFKRLHEQLGTQHSRQDTSSAKITHLIGKAASSLGDPRNKTLAMFHLSSFAFSSRYPSMSNVAGTLTPVELVLTGAVSMGLVYHETGGRKAR
jgi:hypothetical protein